MPSSLFPPSISEMLPRSVFKVRLRPFAYAVRTTQIVPVRKRRKNFCFPKCSNSWLECFGEFAKHLWKTCSGNKKALPVLHEKAANLIAKLSFGNPWRFPLIGKTNLDRPISSFPPFFSLRKFDYGKKGGHRLGRGAKCFRSCQQGGSRRFIPIWQISQSKKEKR